MILKAILNEIFLLIWNISFLAIWFIFLFYLIFLNLSFLSNNLIHMFVYIIQTCMGKYWFLTLMLCLWVSFNKSFLALLMGVILMVIIFFWEFAFIVNDHLFCCIVFNTFSNFIVDLITVSLSFKQSSHSLQLFLAFIHLANRFIQNIYKSLYFSFYNFCI